MFSQAVSQLYAASRSLPFLACANFNIVLGGGRQGQDRNEYQLLSRTSHWGWSRAGRALALAGLRNVPWMPCVIPGTVMPVETISPQPPPHTALVITHSPSLGVLETTTEARLFIDCQLSRSLKINHSPVIFLLPTHKHFIESKIFYK